MNASIRRLAVLSLAALAAGTVPTFAAPASASAMTVSSVHSASYEQRAVWGGLEAVYVSGGRVSADDYHVYDPWTTTAADGLRVRISCSAANPWLYLQILFVGGAGSMATGGNHINVALPRPAETPSCDPVADAVVEVLPGGDESRAVRGGVRVVPLHPGAYFVSVPDPKTGGVVAVPVGQDLDTGVDLFTCVTVPSGCPASGPNGTARLLLYTTGADAFRGSPLTNGFFNIVLNRVQRGANGQVSYGPDIYQYVTSVESTGQRTERVQVSLPDITTAGEYRVRAWNYQTGFADQDLRLYFGNPR
jgi:hypothetical protein